MAIATAPSFAGFDVTSRTEGRSVHNVLLDAMFATSRILEVIGMGKKIDQQRHEWISLSAPATYITSTDVGGTTIDGHATNTGLVVSAADGAKVMDGTLLVNASRATPIGTYQRNEILQVAGVSAGTLTLVRDIGAFNAGTGSAVHAATDIFRILDTPHQEGSVASLDPNTYSADAILDNYSSIHTIKMQLTGSQMERSMEVVKNEVERQWQREILRMKNEIASMVLYGFNSSTAGGSDTVIRYTKGIQDFMVDNINAANGLVDYTTTVLTANALNDLFEKLTLNGADAAEPYKIACHPSTKRVMGTWDSDLVRTERLDDGVGREIKVFQSDLGFNCEIIADPMIHKNDVFIIQPEKITMLPFRPWSDQEWGLGTQAPNGDDMWYKRSIGEFTLMVLDPGYAHAGMTYLSW